MNFIIEIKTEDGTVVGKLLAQPKEFKTGSRGFYANGKIEWGTRRYQAQIQMVEIGSKPKPPEDFPLG